MLGDVGGQLLVRRQGRHSWPLAATCPGRSWALASCRGRGHCCPARSLGSSWGGGRVVQLVGRGRVAVLLGRLVLAPLHPAPGPGLVAAAGAVEWVGLGRVSLVAAARVLGLARSLTGSRAAVATGSRPLGLGGLARSGRALPARLLLLHLHLALDSLLLLVVGVLQELRRRLLVVDPARVADLHRHQLLQKHVGGQVRPRREVCLHSDADTPGRQCLDIYLGVRSSHLSEMCWALLNLTT